MEASEILSIYVHEDDSVHKKLTKKAIKLQKQYYKRRKINEKYINKKSPLKKAISIVFDFALIAVALFCGLVCFCNVSSRMQNLPPSIGGYMAMQIVSGSMRASGCEIGDSVMVGEALAYTDPENFATIINQLNDKSKQNNNNIPMTNIIKGICGGYLDQLSFSKRYSESDFNYIQKSFTKLLNNRDNNTKNKI